MISFEILKNEDLCKEEFAKYSAFKEKILKALSEFGDGNVAVYVEGERAVMRIYSEGEYLFSPLRALSKELTQDIRSYSVREEIGLLFDSVTREELTLIKEIFPLVSSGEIADGLFSARILTEVDLLKRAPKIKSGKIRLSGIKEKDIPSYAAVCRDESALLYWGYDYREDEPDADDLYFFKEQRRSRSLGVSLTYGVRYKRRLIGEASFYALDYLGGAEISFRLLPDYRGKGLGRATLEGLLFAAEKIGLSTLYATVDCRNTPSVSLLSEYMDKESEGEGIIRFCLKGE